MKSSAESFAKAVQVLDQTKRNWLPHISEPWFRGKDPGYNDCKSKRNLFRETDRTDFCPAAPGMIHGIKAVVPIGVWPILVQP